MKISNENKILIGIAAVGVIVTGAVIIKRIKKKKELQAIAESKQEAQQQAQDKPAEQVKKIDKILKLGDKGAEVKELQILLGFTGAAADGRFGNKTLNRLQMVDGGNEISLSEFKKKYPKVTTRTPLSVPAGATPPLVANTATVKIQAKKKELPKVGARLMSNVKRMAAWASKQRVDGNFYNTGIVVKRFMYGEDVGTFESTNTNGRYLVNFKGKKVFVDGNNVKAY